MKSAFLLSVLILTTPLCSSADDGVDGTGNQLVTFCNDQAIAAKGEAEQVCAAYVKGVLQGLVGGAAFVKWHDTNVKGDTTTMHPDDGLAFCMPANATWGQDERVVSKFLHDHPNILNKDDWLLVLWAFEDAWPCPAK